jgi:DNA polymerase III subunit delta
MVTTAQKVFKDLETGTWKPVYLVVGMEPFQIREVVSQFKSKFVKEETSQAMNFETWDGEGLNGSELLNSLEMLPGLFSSEEEIRLVICHRFDKVSAASLEILQRYFDDPSPSTVFLMLAEKVDKRKSWYKAVEGKGDILEVREPYDRDWPKWLGFFEKKTGKKIEPEAWEMLVLSSGRTLSVLASELDKMAIYVAERPLVRVADVQAMGSYPSGEDVFSFVEDLVMKRKSEALRKYEALLRSGESDVKVLSIIVRQFRMLDHASRLMRSGMTDSKAIAGQIGAHPFFVSKILTQVKLYSEKQLGEVLDFLAQADYQIKTGNGNLFERFLIPFFSYLSV